MPQIIANTQLPNAVRRFGALMHERALLPVPLLPELERSSSAYADA